MRFYHFEIGATEDCHFPLTKIVNFSNSNKPPSTCSVITTSVFALGKIEGKTGWTGRIFFDHSHINLTWELAFSGAGYRTITSLHRISPRALESRSVYTRTLLPYSAIAATRTSGKSSNSDTVSGVREFRKAFSSTKRISPLRMDFLLPLLLPPVLPSRNAAIEFAAYGPPLPFGKCR